jgi:hypothetical protein
VDNSLPRWPQTRDHWNSASPISLPFAKIELWVGAGPQPIAMARSKTPPRPEPEPPQVPSVQGIQLIESQIAKAEDLLQKRPIQTDEYSTWELLTSNYLEKAFGNHRMAS